MSVKRASNATPLNVIEFRDGDRTFICETASSPATPGTTWWWVSVTGESQRYAAFRTEAGDAPANVQPRILAYYAKMVADRARPREIRTQWGRPKAPAANASESPTGTAQ